MTSSVLQGARRRSAPAPFPPPPSRHLLASGLEVWVAEDATVPLVALLWSTPWGAALDPPGCAGLAVLAAKLMREGTARRSARRLCESLEALGADLFSRCDWDGSAILLELLSEDLDAGLPELCEIAQSPCFPDEAIARWRRWQAAELARRRCQPSTAADDALAKALYGPARYGLPLLGTEDGVRRLERSHVRQVHGCGADPRRARVIAVGCVDEGALLRRLEGLVAAEATGGGSAPLPAAVAAADPTGRRVYLVDAPGAPRTELRLGWIGVSRTDAGFARLAVLNAVLGGPSWSRLGRALRERCGYVYGVRSSLEERGGPAPFVIGTTAGHGDAGVVVREILHEIERLHREPAPAEELQGVREHLEGRRAAKLQTCHSRARQLRKLAAHGLSAADVAREIEEVRNLCPEDLSAAARRFLDLQCTTLVAVGPAARLRAQLAPFGEVSILDECGTEM